VDDGGVDRAVLAGDLRRAAMTKKVTVHCQACGQYFRVKLGEDFRHGCTGTCDTRSHLHIRLYLLPEAELRKK
jgi:hypothetical protein